MDYYELYVRQEKEIEALRQQLSKCIEILAQHNLLQKGDSIGQRYSKSNQ